MLQRLPVSADLMRPRLRIALACLGLLVLSLLYCLPGHPSAGRAVVLDGALHVALFAGLGLAVGMLMPGRWWPLAGLAILAGVLEVVQWRVGGYRRIEWADILANEVGLALACLLCWAMWKRRGR